MWAERRGAGEEVPPTLENAVMLLSAWHPVPLPVYLAMIVESAIHGRRNYLVIDL